MVPNMLPTNTKKHKKQAFPTCSKNAPKCSQNVPNTFQTFPRFSNSSKTHVSNKFQKNSKRHQTRQKMIKTCSGKSNSEVCFNHLHPVRRYRKDYIRKYRKASGHVGK